MDASGSSNANREYYDAFSADYERERKNYYWGEMIGQEIQIRMQDDRGNRPIEWLLRRTG